MIEQFHLNNFVEYVNKVNCSKYCYASQIFQFKFMWLDHSLLNGKAVIFHIFQFSIRTLFKCQTDLFDPLIGPYQVLPFPDRVDLGATAMKGKPAFLKIPVLLELNHQIVITRTHFGCLTPLQRSIQYILQIQPTQFSHIYLLGITQLFPHNELVHLPYIAVATNTRAD